MEIILLERVEKLGAIGDVVRVKDGFARNFLLPNKKALRANASNRKLFEANRSKIEADNDSRRDDAEKGAKDVEGKSVKLIRQASNTGQLYGSVSARDIIEALDIDGIKLVKSQIILGRPIKAIGIHEVKVALHPEVTASITINVARSPEEADLQAQGVDVMADMFERDNAPLAGELDVAPEVTENSIAEASESEAAETAAENAETAPEESSAASSDATAEEPEKVAEEGE